MKLSNQVLLAAEDRLGLALGLRLVLEQPALQIWREVDGGGYVKLKDDVAKYNQMAGNGLPVLLLTDLDRRPCSTDLLNSWLGEGRKPNMNGSSTVFVGSHSCGWLPWWAA